MMQAMSALDDDATLTQLATAWVGAFLVRSLSKQLCDSTMRYIFLHRGQSLITQASPPIVRIVEFFTKMGKGT